MRVGHLVGGGYGEGLERGRFAVAGETSRFAAFGNCRGHRSGRR